MKPYLFEVTVLYSETDQMGIVHHSNYLKYYETARWSLFNHYKIPYRLIEEQGFLLPVVKVNLEFIKPAYYDDKLVIETWVTAVKGATVAFSYNIFNAHRQLINKANISVAFVNKETRKPCKPPNFIAGKIAQMMLAKLADSSLSDLAFLDSEIDQPANEPQQLTTLSRVDSSIINKPVFDSIKN